MVDDAVARLSPVLMYNIKDAPAATVDAPAANAEAKRTPKRVITRAMTGICGAGVVVGYGRVECLETESTEATPPESAKGFHRNTSISSQHHFI